MISEVVFTGFEAGVSFLINLLPLAVALESYDISFWVYDFDRLCKLPIPNTLPLGVGRVVTYLR